MSNIGNVQSNPIYQPTQANTASTVAAAANFANHAVTVATVAQQPAQPSGIGDKIKGFFGSIKEAFQDLGRKITDATTFKPLADKVFKATTAQPIEPGKLSKADREAGSYAFVKDNADGINGGNINTFMRSNNSGSKLTQFAAKTPETTAVMERVRDLVRDDEPIAVEGKAYGLAGDGSPDVSQSLFPSLRNENPGFEAAVAARTVTTIDAMMCEVFGTPGNQQSIDAAAARLPQSLCDQLAILHRAVDNSAAPANLKDGMKLHLARDALMLRAVNPTIADLVGAQQNRDGERNENSLSMMQVSKAMQSLVNGHGMGNRDTHTAVQQAGAHMQNRWDAGFEDFIEAVVARADPNVVASAENRGQRTLDARV